MPGDLIRVGGFPIRNTTTPAMTRFLQRRIAQRRKIAVGFANHHFVTACQSLDCRDEIGTALMLVNDGIGMQLAAALRFGRSFDENMNGTDFVPHFLAAARQPCSVYLIGCDTQVVRQAARAVARLPRCRVVGFCDGFSLWEHEASVIREIADVHPDVLLVGLGNPLQERWIVENWASLDAKVILGVGALFEWMTGSRRRAPPVFRRARLEWAYRLMIEPRRLLRRYTIDAVMFLSLVLRADGRLTRRNQAP